ncbi:MAG: hypothetical protein WC759_04915 [Candidatus Micrarchaeia archaeon]|jgi:hypothetical protein
MVAGSVITAPPRHMRLHIKNGTINGVKVLKLEPNKSILMDPLFDEAHRSHPRAKVGGSRGMERLVLINYDLLVRNVRQLIREKIEAGELDESHNTVRDIRNACLELDGLHPSEFIRKDSSPLRRGIAFGNMVKQFFLDEALIKELYGEVKSEMVAEIFKA